MWDRVRASFPNWLRELYQLYLQGVVRIKPTFVNVNMDLTWVTICFIYVLVMITLTPAHPCVSKGDNKNWVKVLFKQIFDEKVALISLPPPYEKKIVNFEIF